MITLIARSAGGTDGASQSALDVLLALQQAHSRIELVFGNGATIPSEIDGYSFKDLKTQRGLRHTPWPTHWQRNAPRDLIRRLKYELTSRNYLKEIRKRSPDMIFVNSLGNHDLHDPYRFEFPDRSVLIFREQPDFWKSNPAALEAKLNELKIYRGYIFVAERVREAWRPHLTLHESNSRVIYNTGREAMAAQLLDQSKQVLQAALPGFKSDHFNVVCVSSLKERKGQDLFLKHHEQLIDAIPKLNLILIGGSKGKWAQAYLKQLNQLDNSAIQYLGERTDALPFTRAADAVLLPTRSEACPRTVLEAMILKTPIVSAPVGGIPEMLDHEISGMLFAHSNTIEMVEHLARIANNRDFGRILADNAHTKYWETFSRQRQIESYSEAIQHFWPHK